MTDYLAGLLRDIWQNAAARPAHAVVPVLVASLGMAALTVLLSGLAGLGKRADALIEDFGANVFEICGGARGNPLQEGRAVDAADVRILSANLADCSVSVVFRSIERIDPAGMVEIVGTDERHPRWGRRKPLSGRLLDRMDVLTAARCCVVNAGLASQLSLEEGRALVIAGTPFVVVGIVPDEPGGESWQGSAMKAWIPHTAARFWLGGKDWDSEAFDSMLVAVQDEGAMDEAVRAATRILKQRKGGPGNLTIVTPEALLKELRSVRNSLVAFAGGGALLGLGLGSVVLALLMAANVRSRVVEIGLRRSLGATSRDILALFICEGCVSGFVAALLGVLLGCAGIAAARGASSMPLPLGFPVVMAPMAVGVALGGLSAWAPARLAASIRPAESLRWE